MKIPVIENIHQKVLEAVTTGGGKLEMGSVHVCETTHCRAGWAVALAGKEGFDLEKQTDWGFAAMQIYKASSPIRVSPTRFFENNEVAMKDIIRCAEEEKALTQSDKND